MIGGHYGDSAPQVQRAIAAHGRLVRRAWRSSYPQEGGDILYRCQDCHGWWVHGYWACVPQEGLERPEIRSVKEWVAEMPYGEVES
jgi:hypothetical protein